MIEFLVNGELEGVRGNSVDSLTSYSEICFKELNKTTRNMSQNVPKEVETDISGIKVRDASPPPPPLPRRDAISSDEISCLI